MNTRQRIKEMTGFDIGDNQPLPEGDDVKVSIRADFPIDTDGTRFALNVLYPTTQPSTDYSERMRLLAKALRELSEEIERDHAAPQD